MKCYVKTVGAPRDPQDAGEEETRITKNLASTPRSDVPTQPVLYKYYAFNKWTPSIFERNETYFQSPDCFNDPFDSKLSTTYEGTEEQRVPSVPE